MSTYDYDIIIIGGGSAGLSLASISARIGASVALIDAEELGGDCLHYGCVPSKTLIKSAHVAYTAKHSDKWGIKTEHVQADFPAITKAIADVIGTIVDHVDNPERFEALGCTVFTNTRAYFEDERTVNVGNKSITGRTIALCAGTRPHKLELKGIEDVGYQTNETIFRMEKQPKSLIVLGSGPIGCELAQSFARLGTDVTLVNRSDRILGNEDKDIQDVIRKRFTAEGIELMLGYDIKEARGRDSQKELVLEKDGKQLPISAEEILVAVGRTSNADSLQVESAGIELDKRGYIVTNAKLQTSKKHIYAAGDITGNLQFTHNAGYQAGVVFSNAIFKLPKKLQQQQIPWTTFTDPEVASCGLNEKRATEQGIQYDVHTYPFSHQDRALAERENEGFIKVLTGKKGKILGCQIVGLHAGELIHEWIVALAKGMKLKEMSSITHVYPTLSGISQQIAGSVLADAFFTPKVRKWVRRIYGYRNVKIDN